ncbi:MAG: hypothetical protein ACR2NP_17015 [Pirellulaceae bacterium]
MNARIKSNWSSLVLGCTLLPAIGVMLLSGCATTPTNKAPLQPEMTAPAAAQGPGYKIIFANHLGGQPKIYQGRINPGMTVQDALEESGATKKYTGMLIDLARRVSDSGQVLKLPVNYDHEVSHVIDAQNYAIHPGDEILIRQNNPGPMDAMFRSISASGLKQKR